MAVREYDLETSHGRISVAETDGRGPPVLLIHGNSGSKRAYEHQLDGEVGRRHRLIAYDLPGHGESEDARDPQRTYSMPGYADLAAEILGLLKVPEVVVVGWSLGGHIGLELISRYPGLKGLLITGTPPVGKSAEAVGQGFVPSDEIQLASKEVYAEGDAEAFARTTLNIKGDIPPAILATVKRTDGKARSYMFQAFLAGSGDDQLAIAETSKVPLAVVSGADEHFVNNLYLGKIRYANLWEGAVFILPGIGHAPFWEAPAVFDPLLLRFMDAVF